jgi:hypothetical protein
VLAALGCQAEIRAQIVVVVHTDLEVPAELEEVQILVFGPGDPETMPRRDSTVRVGPGGQTLPFSFGVAPRDEDTSRVVRIVAIGKDGGVERVRASARSSFVAGQRLRLDIPTPRYPTVDLRPWAKNAGSRWASPTSARSTEPVRSGVAGATSSASSAPARSTPLPSSSASRVDRGPR